MNKCVDPEQIHPTRYLLRVYTIEKVMKRRALLGNFDQQPIYNEQQTFPIL